MLVVGVLAALLGFTLSVLSAHVEGPSMLPTMEPGDVLLVDKLPVVGGAPGRGDVIVFHLGGANGNSSAVKRVIGVPGDELQINAGRVLIKPGGFGDWQQLQEPYLTGKWTVNEFCCDPNGRATVAGKPQALTIPAGKYFVLGDNRDDSEDSRVIGLVASGLIEGTVVGRYWPLDRAGLVGSAPTFTPAR